MKSWALFITDLVVDGGDNAGACTFGEEDSKVSCEVSKAAAGETTLILEVSPNVNPLEEGDGKGQVGTGEVTAGAVKLNPVNGFVADSTAPTPDTSVVSGCDAGIEEVAGVPKVNPVTGSPAVVLVRDVEVVNAPVDPPNVNPLDPIAPPAFKPLDAAPLVS